MSSSSESEDENLRKFAEAVDVKLFDNSFYKPEEERKEVAKTESLKSQRYLDEEENVYQSEINISETMKEFIAKKMSNLIKNRIEFVTIKEQKIKNDDVKDRVKLLKGCKQTIKCTEDPAEEVIRKKVEIKRRKVEEDGMKESEKLCIAATSILKIQKEISFYENKTRHKPFNFKLASDNKYNLQEPPNEFTSTRKRNNWDESKIKTTKNFGKSLDKIL